MTETNYVQMDKNWSKCSHCDGSFAEAFKPEDCPCKCHLSPMNTIQTIKEREKEIIEISKNPFKFFPYTIHNHFMDTLILTLESLIKEEEWKIEEINEEWAETMKIPKNMLELKKAVHKEYKHREYYRGQIVSSKETISRLKGYLELLK